MSDGALMELVSRGKRDSYFIENPARTWFGTDYYRRHASVRQIQIIQPEGPVRFGSWVDIELPRGGDILKTMDIRIQMPTWLPPDVAAINRDLRYDIQVQTKAGPTHFAHFGWTNGIANYLIDRWALYADNVMITEGWGFFNSWFPDMETTQMKAPLIHASTGTHNGSEENIQGNATVPELAFRLPLPGCQVSGDIGLPLCAMWGQRLYVRLWLKDKTHLVESGRLSTGAIGGLPEYELCPEPWGGKRIQITDNIDRLNPVITYAETKKEWEMGQPVLYARCDILKVDESLRHDLQHMRHQIVFRQQARDDWFMDNTTWAQAGAYKKQLEMQGFFQALFLGFTSKARELQNKYRDINPISNPDVGPAIVFDWLVNLGLIVNGEERIGFWPPKKFQQLANNTQLRRDVEVALYYLVFGVNPEYEPAGTFNLTRTQKSVLTMQLAQTLEDPQLRSRQTRATVMGLAWNVFDINSGQSRLIYQDEPFFIGNNRPDSAR
jgi:hypothetical protein